MTALQASTNELAARGGPTARAELARRDALTQASKRSDMIDEVNLNVDGDAGLTLTFVEEVGDDEDED